MNLISAATIKETNEATVKSLATIRGLKDYEKNLDIDSFLQKYFSKDSIRNYVRDLIDHNNKWAKCFAGKPIWGIKVNPLKLEPFVARYVNALNGIGAKTNSSCDGWHKESENRLFVEFKDRYSMIWHRLMCKRLDDDHGIVWDYHGLEASFKLPASDQGKIRKYLNLNKNAESFENMASQLLDLKRKLLIKAKNKVKNNLSVEDAEKWMAGLLEEIDSEA